LIFENQGSGTPTQHSVKSAKEAGIFQAQVCLKKSIQINCVCVWFWLHCVPCRPVPWACCDAD